jgi:hypothetical protein
MAIRRTRHPRWKVLLFGGLTGLLLTARMGALALSRLHNPPVPLPPPVENPIQSPPP